MVDNHVTAFDIIIPARNEAATVYDVVVAACAARGRARVIVVDDGSTDDTAAEAERGGAEVVRVEGGGSKARALAAGVAASDANILVFFDADILRARPAHFEQLVVPVLDERFVMCCGLVDYGAWGALYARFPPITGLRALRREIFTAIPDAKLNGFQIEIMINEVVARGGLRSAICTLAGTDHRSKLHKLGVWRGVWSHLSMTAELLHCLTFVPLWTYRSYLANLTILENS